MKEYGLALSGALLVATISASANQVGIKPDREALNHAYAGKTYSPYAERDFPTFPLWGETHLHTGLSMDAGLFGNRLGLSVQLRIGDTSDITVERSDFSDSLYSGATIANASGATVTDSSFTGDRRSSTVDCRSDGTPRRAGQRGRCRAHRRARLAHAVVRCRRYRRWTVHHCRGQHCSPVDHRQCRSLHLDRRAPRPARTRLLTRWRTQSRYPPPSVPSEKEHP